MAHTQTILGWLHQVANKPFVPKWRYLNENVCSRKLKDEYTKNWKNQNLSISFKRLFNCFRLKKKKTLKHKPCSSTRKFYQWFLWQSFFLQGKNRRRLMERAHRIWGLPPTLYSWQQWVMRCYRVKQSYRKSCPNNLWHWITTPSLGDNSCHQWTFSNMDFLQNTIFNRQQQWEMNLMAKRII